MSVTNPPPIRVPQEFAKDRATFAYFNELHTFLRLLWERTGGGTDVIEGAGDAGDSMVSTYSHAARIASLGLDVDAVERTAFLGLSTPDKAQIEAVRAEIGKPDVFSFTPDNARYGHVTVELAELDTTAGIGLSTLPLLAKVGGIDERLSDAEEDIAALVVATADDPLLAYSALPDKARIEALKDEITKPTLFDLTPDAARYGSVTVQLATLEEGLADAVADIAAIAAGDPLLAYSSLPDNARIAALSERVADPLLSLAISSDGAKIAALSQRMDNEGWQHFTPDAARYGELSVRVGGVEADVIDLAADVAAITAGDPILAYSTLPLLARVGAFDERITATELDIADLESDVAAITAGDPILAYSSLPDNARIGALSLRVDDIEAFPLPMLSGAARYGSLVIDVAGLTDDVGALQTGLVSLSADVVEIDNTLATLHPLHAKVAEISQRSDSPLLHTPDAARFGYLNDRVGAAEESIADVAADVAAISVGDPLLAYSALPDKAAISALRDDVTAVDRAMVALQPLHAKLAADSVRLDTHEALNEAYFAYFEILLTAIADVANTQFMLAGPPLAGRVAAVSEQATATNILAFPGPDAARYAALVEQLKDEVQNLRIEIAALYSDRAKLAHLDNRVNDMEIVSWL